MSAQLFQIAAKALIRDSNGDVFMTHVPQWGHVPEHWDLPGGRIDENENFAHALDRELLEELGVSYTKTPQQLMCMQTNISIPVGDKMIPLVYVIYAVDISDTHTITLSEDTREDNVAWFSPTKAAELMKFKFSSQFCDLVKNLT